MSRDRGEGQKGAGTDHEELDEPSFGRQSGTQEREEKGAQASSVSFTHSDVGGGARLKKGRERRRKNVLLPSLLPHLLTLQLIPRRAVNQIPHGTIFIDTAQEILGFEVRTDLGDLDREGIRSVGGAFKAGVGIFDDFEDLCGVSARK